MKMLTPALRPGACCHSFRQVCIAARILRRYKFKIGTLRLARSDPMPLGLIRMIRMTDTPDARLPPAAQPPNVPRWRDPATAAAVSTITQVLLAVAAGWFLLQQLTPVLRPLLVAVF